MSSPFSSLFGEQLISKAGPVKTTDSLRGKKAVGVYFSAHWCGACRKFTPKLAEAYKSMTSAGLPFEIVFLSFDRDEAAFSSYYAEQPWLALPFASRKAKNALAKRFEGGIPKLVIFDEHGAVITKDGRAAISRDPSGAEFPWKPAPPRVDRAAVEAAFAVFDSDGSGRLTLVEFKAVLQDPEGGKSLSDKQVQDLFQKVDTDKSGDVDVNEFINGWELLQASGTKEAIKRDPKHKIAKSKQGRPQKTAVAGDPKKWEFPTTVTAGSFGYIGTVTKIEEQGSIEDGIKKFKADPAKYMAIAYQTSFKDKKEAKYTLVLREGLTSYTPKEAEGGWQTVILAQYQPLPTLALKAGDKDKFTDGMSYQGVKLGSMQPGRGGGVCDGPNPPIKILGDVDPSDVGQGGVGNCWLLSGISSLAEFDGAIARIFRKNKSLASMPTDGANKYIVTLWDMSTWKEVDVEVDERLATNKNGTLLASRPSPDGELWVCYLEKALAFHCGGWDKIKGGQCTRAWALLTGCKEQYYITQGKGGGKWKCCGWYNASTKEWKTFTRGGHGDGGIFRGEFPAGGSELSSAELFERMCAWDDNNYIMGAGTGAGDDSNDTDGIVDGHAYSVLEVHNDVAGTKFDLIKMRNPHGRTEFAKGIWTDGGAGWTKYPQVKKELNPIVANDGVFWIAKEEFFKYFKTIYLCAKDMSEFLID